MPVSGSELLAGERGLESTDSEKERDGEMVEAAELVEREVRRDVYSFEIFCAGRR